MAEAINLVAVVKKLIKDYSMKAVLTPIVDNKKAGKSTFIWWYEYYNSALEFEYPRRMVTRFIANGVASLVFGTVELLLIIWETAL